MTTNQPLRTRPEAGTTLEPPAPSTELTLTPPQPVAAVAPAAAERWCRSTRPRFPAWTKMVHDYVGEHRDARRALARVREEGREHPHDGRRRHPRRGGRQQPHARDASACVRARADSRRAPRSRRRCSTCGKTIEDLDPVEGVGRAQAARHHPVRRQAARLLPPLRERADAHQRDLERARTEARTSCARTTPRSSRRRCTSGRRCNG